jgi:hypothetical protein
MLKNMRSKHCLLFVSMIICVPSKVEAFWTEAICGGTISAVIVIAYTERDEIMRCCTKSITTPTDAAGAQINQREIEHLVSAMISSDIKKFKMASGDFEACLINAQEDMQQHKPARSCESYEKNMVQKTQQSQKNIREYNNRLVAGAAYEKQKQVPEAVAQKEQPKISEEQ